MSEGLPDAVLRASLHDIGVNIAVANRLEELQLFDVASYLDCSPDAIREVIGDKSHQQILELIESLRERPTWRPPERRWRPKPR